MVAVWLGGKEWHDMEHSEELRDLTLRFYKASATGDLSFFDRHVSRQEGAEFIGTDSNEWWEGLEALREAARTQSEAIEGGGLQIADSRRPTASLPRGQRRLGDRPQRFVPATR